MDDHLILIGTGCLLSAFLATELVRGETGIGSIKLTRKQHRFAYWAMMAVTAALALTVFQAALRS